MGTHCWPGTVMVAFTLMLAGCGDEEKEARKRAQQELVLTLRQEVELLKVQLGEQEEGNPEEDLRTAKAALDEANGKVEALRAQLTELTAQRAAAQSELEAYQQKYRIPEENDKRED